MAHAIHTAHTGFSIAGYITNTVANLRETLAARKLYADTVHELNSLDQRELDDLGIARGRIKEIAYKHVYGA